MQENEPLRALLSLKWHKLRLWAPTEHAHIEHVLYAEQSIIFTM